MVRTAGGDGSAFLYGYWDDLPLEGYEWLYAPGATAGLIPTNNGQTAVFAGTTPARMKAARRAGSARGAFGAVLATVSPTAAERVAAARAPEQLRGFVGLPGYLRQAWGPGWALVGDAGGFEDPLSTHGITDALRDAELLAAAVEQIHGGSVGEAVALARYQATRDSLAGPLFSVVETIGSYGWTMPQLRRLLLEASSAMTEQVEAMQGRDKDHGLVRASTS